jgi:hypothetical protein
MDQPAQGQSVAVSDDPNATPGAQQAQGAATIWDNQELVQTGTQAVNAQQALQYAQQVVRTLPFQDPDLHYPGATTQLKQGVTTFLFGSVGTWKTTWAGTWPKPIFLSVGAEGGDDALAMLPSLYGIPIPPVYHITSQSMMVQKVEQIAAHHQAMDVNTVVVDSVTYYVDMWIAEVMGGRMNDPKIQDKMRRSGIDAVSMTTRDWGLLAMHMRNLMMRLHNAGLNVIWISLEKEIKQGGEGPDSRTVIAVEPYIRGETFIKLPGMCKMIIHADKMLKPDFNVPGRMYTQPVYYTSPNMKTKIIRHKYGNAFPEGKLMDWQGGDLPHFWGVDSRIGQFVYKTA